MRDKIVKILAIFIPFKSLRKRFRKKFSTKETYQVKSKCYGKIWTPYYPDVKISSNIPEIYNKDGEKMEIFYLRDNFIAFLPYLNASKYFLWDRYNIGLDTHFYAHATILETNGNPKNKYAYFVESESIIPEQYAIFDTHKGIEKDFDAVFTYSEKLLNTLPNAKFFPSCAEVWYGKEVFNGVKDDVIQTDKAYETKVKNVSMVCSNKIMTYMHKVRHNIASRAQKTGLCDIYGRFNGGEFMKYKSVSLKDYRFQIVVENDIKPYYYTEKIMDCFASMTIPVYYGAKKIDDYFNPDGIIKFDEKTDLEKLLKTLTEEEYISRLSAVKDNYYRAMKYNNIDDLLYEMYFKK